jgi:hypothetical protein
MRASRFRVVVVFMLVSSLAVILALQVQAFESAHLTLGNVAGEGWSLDGVTVQLDWKGESSARVVIQAAGAQLPGQLGRLKDLQFVCDAAELTAAGIACAQGMLGLQSSRLGRQSLLLKLHYRHSDKQVNVRVRNIRAAGGTIALTAAYRDDGWSADVTGKGLVLTELAREVRASGITLPPLTLAGALELELGLRGQGARLDKAVYDARLQAENFSDESGRYAGEALDVTFTGSLQPVRDGWQVHSSLTARQGAVYIDPVYIEVGTAPVVAEAALDWLPRTRQVELRSLSYRQPGSLDLSAQGRFEWQHAQPVRQLQLELKDAVLPSAYETYLQPWVTRSLAGNLETSGHLRGHLRIDDGRFVRGNADLQSVSLVEKGGLFSFDNLSGQLDWSDSTTPEYSTLGWDAGTVYRASLGKTAIEIESTGNTVRLVRPVRIPVLDGALDIESFSLEYPGREALRWQVDGILIPVSMQQLTRALDWPEFGGKLSGVIPSVTYDSGVLSVGGVLLVRVFDGLVTLRDLQLTDPFGLIPRLQVDVMIDNIDLESLTGAFSFGLIEGRLDGRVERLSLESWRPVAFDAEFATPADDSSRHRISQKAVDNIANIGGGGVGGALSRGFLQFFKDFPYDRLGIRCRLENGVCDMGGVAPAENGYYLVKGRFIPPRLDVVGYAERVNWDSLVAQIIAVTRKPDMVVK